ncbi:hypothetical protein BsWGS_26198 [Bradybaena similaris]
MGNSQTQMPDDNDDAPRYNFYESVLRDAQIESLSSHPPHDDDDVNNGDEYHSAEENDNDNNSADNSRGNEDSAVADGRHESREQHNLLLQWNSQMPAAEGSSMVDSPAHVNLEQSVNNYGAGRLNRKDRSHRAALANRRRRSTSRHTDTDSNLKSDKNTFLNNREISTVASCGDPVMNLSNVQQLSATLPRDDLQTATESHELGTCLGKRKMLPNSPQETVLPRKKTLIRNSSKRKWLGLSDSTESEMSETEEEVIRKSYKKRRMVKLSPKKSRRFDRDSRADDSDESRYDKKKCREQLRHCCGCKLTKNYDEGCNNDCRRSQRNNISDSSKRRREYNYEESSHSSSDTSSYEKRHKHKRHETNEDKSEEERDKVKSRRYCRHVRKNNDNNNKNELGIACSKGCHTQTSVPIPGDHQNTMQASTEPDDVVSAAVDTNILNSPCHTFKMGNLSFRNSLGKVFPLKSPLMKDAATTAALDTWGNTADTSDTQSPLGAPNPRHSATYSSALKIDAALPTEKGPNSNIFIRSVKDTEGLYEQANSGSQLSVQTILYESPFKNVVLTPSISDTTLACLPQQPTKHKTLASDISDDISDMEVEQSDITVNKSTQFVNSRPKKNAAVRFRHFWLEKKKNISQNLKSLFSRKNVASGKLPDTTSPTWQTFSTAQAQFAWRDSLGSAVESPSSFFRKPSMTSPSMNQVTPIQQQPEKFSEVVSSFSTQSAHRHVTPQLTGITSGEVSSLPPATKMSPVLASAGRNLKQISLPANSSLEWLPSDGQDQVLSCRLAGMVDMSVSTGELADQKTAGIVNWTDSALTHTVTCCSRSIAAKAGPLMQTACNDYIGTQGKRLDAPDVLVTSAGGRLDSSVEAILHAVEPTRRGGDEENNSRALTEVFANCLRFAGRHLGLHSISCPLIGDGTFPFVTCVQSFVEAVLMFLSEQPAGVGGELFHIHLIIRDTTTAKMAGNFIKSYLECVFCGQPQPGDAFTQDLGHRQHVKDLCVPSKTYLTRDMCSQAQRFTVERTDSGRPRLKRPRL